MECVDQIHQFLLLTIIYMMNKHKTLFFQYLLGIFGFIICHFFHRRFLFLALFDNFELNVIFNSYLTQN